MQEKKKAAQPLDSNALHYLLDADWIIQVFAGRSEAVLAHKCINPEAVAVSYITIGEIYDLAFPYANPQAHLHSFRHSLAPFPLVDLNEPIMERFAEIRSSLRRVGRSSQILISSLVPLRCIII